MNREKSLGMRIGESVFSIGYLAFLMVAMILFFVSSATAGGWAITCGFMTLLLGVGDALHLVPRIIINIKDETDDPREKRKRNGWLGIGNFASSITMTAFYLLLFIAMRQRAYPGTQISGAQMAVLIPLLALALVRLVLCLLPQNHWFDGKGSQLWGVVRNLPFAVIGLITIAYLIVWYGEWLMALLVFASFACYLIVVFAAKQKPVLGMLMIPKTICYICLIALLLARL